MNKTVVLYHGNCFDGMSACWAAWKKFGDDAEYRAVNYGQDFPFNEYGKNDDIYIVDFSYRRDILLALKDEVNKLVVLDHHKTAQKDLEGLDFCIFDMEKSGARLTWEYFHWEKDSGGMFYGEDEFNPPVPKLIQYVEDRDLWRFKLPWSKEINAYIQSYPMTIAEYISIDKMLEGNFERCRTEGWAIERYKNTMVEAQCRHFSIQNVGGYNVPVVNSTILFSEVGNSLCLKYPEYPFAAYFTIRNDGKKQWGLRSIGDFDVSEVAKKLGGGGHKNAAGFIEEVK